MKTSKRPTPKQRSSALDARIGLNLRTLRVSRDLSQARLAEFLGVTFQQVQKYERGGNRLSAACLYTLARHFNVPYGYFFQGLEQGDVPDFPVDPCLLRFQQKLCGIEDETFKIKLVAALDVLLS